MHDITPVTNWEGGRFALYAFSLTASTIGIALSGLPSVAINYTIGVSAAVLASAFYGRGTIRALDFMTSFRA